MKQLEKLKPFDDKSGNLRVIIDTPKGCRNKYAFVHPPRLSRFG
jgi:hypothetical protein